MRSTIKPQSEDMPGKIGIKMVGEQETVWFRKPHLEKTIASLSQEVAFHGEALDALYKAEGIEAEGDFDPPCHEELVLLSFLFEGNRAEEDSPPPCHEELYQPQLALPLHRPQSGA